MYYTLFVHLIKIEMKEYILTSLNQPTKAKQSKAKQSRAKCQSFKMKASSL
jgi:hypothetical protein